MTTVKKIDAIQNKNVLRQKHMQFDSVLSVIQLSQEKKQKPTQDTSYLQNKKSLLQALPLGAPQFPRQISIENEYYGIDTMEGTLSQKNRMKPPVSSHIDQQRFQPNFISKKVNIDIRGETSIINTHTQPGSLIYHENESSRRNFRITYQHISNRTTSARGHNISNEWDKDKMQIKHEISVNQPISHNLIKKDYQYDKKQKIDMQYPGIVLSSARTDSRLIKRPNTMKHQDNSALIRNQTSPQRIVETEGLNNPMKLNGSALKAKYDSTQESQVIQQIEGQVLDMTGLQQTGVKIVYSGFRNINGLQNIMIFTQLVIFKSYPNWWKQKDQLAHNQNIKNFLVSFRKSCICGLLVNCKQKFANLNFSQFDGLDFIAQIQPTISRFGVNLQSIYDAFYSQGIKLNTIYFVDNVDIRDLQQHISRQPLMMSPKDNLKIINLILSEGEYISELNKQEISRLVSLIQNLIQLNKDREETNQINIPSTFNEVIIHYGIQQINNEIQKLTQQDSLSRKLDTVKQKIKQFYRKKQEDSIDSTLEYVAEKRAENFRNNMIEKIKSQNQKVNNLYFIVGDLVQRNIELFRAQDNSSFYKDSKHTDILIQFNQLLQQIQQPPVPQKKESFNSIYFGLQIPEKLYRI